MSSRLTRLIGIGLCGSIVVLFPGLIPAGEFRFQDYISVPSGISPRGLAVGDVTGDGEMDLVVANFGSGTYIGHETESDGEEVWTSTLRVFSTSPDGLVPRGMAPTALSPRGVALYDVDGEMGSRILVTCYDAGVVQLFRWKQGGLQREAEYSGYKKPVGVAAFRIAPQGFLVVAVANFAAGTVSIHRVDGEGRLQDRRDVRVGKGPTQVSFGDVDGDGNTDLVVSCMASHRLDIIPLVPIEGEVTLKTAKVAYSIQLPPGSGPSDVVVADLNGDGRADIATCKFNSNNLSVFLQDRQGKLNPLPVVATGGKRCNGLTVGDVNRDGIMECIVANRDSDRVDVFAAGVENAYDLVSTRPVATEGMVLGPIEVVVMDVNLDGLPDIVVSHMRSDSLRVLLQLPLTVRGQTKTGK
jgi:hypothetical protein